MGKSSLRVSSILVMSILALMTVSFAARAETTLRQDYQDQKERVDRRETDVRYFIVDTASTNSAYGVVLRHTPASGRFLIAALNGVFRPGATVSVFDPEGRPVVGGRVHSIYADDVYVDIDNPALADAITVGFVVGMNVTNEEAGRVIAKSPEVVQMVKFNVQKDKEALYREHRQEWKEYQRQKDLERFQFQMRRMELDFAYSWWWWYW